MFCTQALQSMVLKVLETKIQISMEKKRKKENVGTAYYSSQFKVGPFNYITNLLFP